MVMSLSGEMAKRPYKEFNNNFKIYAETVFPANFAFIRRA
jgi:hypothetical protein